MLIAYSRPSDIAWLLRGAIANALAFGDPDGATSTFQLTDADGADVTSGFVVEAIHQTDWQGRVALSDRPRTNYNRWSDAAPADNRWTLFAASVEATGPAHVPNAIVESTTTAPHGVAFIVNSVGIGTRAVAWVDVAAAAHNIARLSIDSGFNSSLPFAFFDLAAGTVHSVSGTGATAGIRALGDGIFRIWISAVSETAVGFNATLYGCTSFIASTHTGEGVTSLYFGHSQVEVGDTPGVAIPTPTSASVTVTDRAVDAAGAVTLGQVPAATATLDWDGAYDNDLWLSDDAGAALVDGRPARASRLQWLSGAQTTASVVHLRGAWATPLVPRVAGLLGVTLPVGTLIKLAFKRPADADYTYLADTPQQRVVQLPDGSRCAWFVLDAGLDAVEGIEFHLVNDVNGAATIAAAAPIDLGEAWISPAVEIPHEKDWQQTINDPSIATRTLGGQINEIQRPSWRTLQVTFARATLAKVRGGGLANGMDWVQLAAALRGSTPCVAIPRFDTTAELHATAQFGSGRIDGPRHVTGPNYTATGVFDEVPAGS